MALRSLVPPLPMGPCLGPLFCCINKEGLYVAGWVRVAPASWGDCYLWPLDRLVLLTDCPPCSSVTLSSPPSLLDPNCVCLYIVVDAWRLMSSLEHSVWAQFSSMHILLPPRGNCLGMACFSWELFGFFPSVFMCQLQIYAVSDLPVPI